MTAEMDADFTVAPSGQETLRLAAARQPTLILLDARMEDMDGYQVINQLAGQPETCHIPVILMETRFAASATDLHADAVWPAETIYKPIDPAHLLRCLDRLLAIQEMKRSVGGINEFESTMKVSEAEGMLGIDENGRIRYANPAMLKMLRTHYSALIGLSIETRLEQDAHDTQAHWRPYKIATTLAAGRSLQVKRAGVWRNDGTKMDTTFVAIPVQGHTELDAVMVFKARPPNVDDETSVHDALTGLPHRFKFEEVMADLIELYRAKTNVLISRKRDAPCAVMSVGLDHFSYINTGLGYDVGDKLLKIVAHRITSSVSELDVVARLAGDEFTVGMTHMFTAAHATATAQRIQAAIDEPFLIDGHEIFAGASIGIATYPECGETATMLVTNANHAMTSAKADSRHAIRFYTDAMHQHYLDNVAFQSETREAMTGDAFNVRFLPIIRADGEVGGQQATLSWDHPVRGRLDAHHLLAHLQQPQLATPVFNHLLDQACEQMAGVTSDQNEFLVVPISIFQLLNPGFEDRLLSALATNGFSPNRLILELEDELLDVYYNNIVRVLEEVATVGIRTSLNLFAKQKTGLLHLLKLNLNFLKLEQHALGDPYEDPRRSTFAHGLMAMAHSLGIEVIIDAIETPGLSRLMWDLDADYVLPDRRSGEHAS
jgi:diguanylate cyclase (GGDEF)-like protein